MSKTLTLDEIIGLLSGESFDAAINRPDDYMEVLLESEGAAKQAILQWVADEVVGEIPDDSEFWNSEPDTEAKGAMRLKRNQRQILKYHGWTPEGKKDS